MKKICIPIVISALMFAPISQAAELTGQQTSCLDQSLTELAKLPLPKSQPNTVLVLERISIPAPVEEVYRYFQTFPLAKLLTETDSVAGVAYTQNLKGESYLLAGDRRSVCLTSGYGAIEELTENQNNRFAYTVWAYTLPDAAAIAYGEGEFLFQPQNDTTEIIWNYRFALKPDSFPGNLMAPRRWLFDLTFANSDWRTYMQQGLVNFKQGVLSEMPLDKG